MTQQQTTKSKAMTKPLEGILLPDIDNLPDYERGFWEAARSHELRIQQCSGCKKLRHLPTPMCPHCHFLEYDWTKMSGRGTVYSHLIVRHPVHSAIREKEQTPYNICLIELEEQDGLRVVSNILKIAQKTCTSTCQLKLPSCLRWMTRMWSYRFLSRLRDSSECYSSLDPGIRLDGPPVDCAASSYHELTQSAVGCRAGPAGGMRTFHAPMLE